MSSGELGSRMTLTTQWPYAQTAMNRPRQGHHMTDTTVRPPRLCDAQDPATGRVCDLIARHAGPHMLINQSPPLITVFYDGQPMGAPHD